MKMSCPTHGVHFGDEFEQTIQPGCLFWQERGLETMSVESKKQVFEWFTSIPADEISLKEGVTLYFQLWGETDRSPDIVQMKDIFPGYEEMPEAERRALQRGWFKSQKEKRAQQAQNQPQEETSYRLTGIFGKIMSFIGIEIKEKKEENEQP